MPTPDLSPVRGGLVPRTRGSLGRILGRLAESLDPAADSTVPCRRVAGATAPLGPTAALSAAPDRPWPALVHAFFISSRNLAWVRESVADSWVGRRMTLC